MRGARARAPVGLVLAGGLARRLGGGDKGLRQLAGQTMLARVLARFAPQVGCLALSANGDPARFAAYGLAVLPDREAIQAGPLAGLLAGLGWAGSTCGADWLATVPADMPLLPLDLVARLAARAEATGAPIAVAASGGRPSPVAGLWSVDLAGDLADYLAAGGRKVLDWVGRHPHCQVDFPPAGSDGRTIDPLVNVNTPADLAEVEAWLAAGGQP